MDKANRLASAICNNNEIIYAINRKDRNLINEVFDILLPKVDGKKLINYRIDLHLLSAATFYANDREIVINPIMMENFLEHNLNNYIDRVNDYEKNYLAYIFFVQCLAHEVMHSHQYLMGTREIKSPSRFISNSYNLLYEFITRNDFNNSEEKKKHLEILKKYHSEAKFLLLERNAEIESINLTCKVATNSGLNATYCIFDNLRKLYANCGYFNNNKGSIYETFETIDMLPEYNKIYEKNDFPVSEKIRYGLEISESTRQKILKKMQ